MVAPIASPDPQALYSPLNSDNRPAPVPTEPPASAPPSNPVDQVTISSEAQNLFATTAVPGNGQVDQAATGTQPTQQTQRTADVYTATAPVSVQSADRSPPAVAASSDSSQTDELRTAQGAAEAYQQAAQSTNAQGAPRIDEKA